MGLFQKWGLSYTARSHPVKLSSKPRGGSGVESSLLVLWRQAQEGQLAFTRQQDLPSRLATNGPRERLF